MKIKYQYQLYIPGVYQVYTTSWNIHGIYVVCTDYIPRRGSRWNNGETSDGKLVSAKVDAIFEDMQLEIDTARVSAATTDSGPDMVKLEGMQLPSLQARSVFPSRRAVAASTFRTSSR
jgi:hypothetical protein